MMTSREDAPGIEGEVRVAGVGEAHVFKRGRVTDVARGFLRCECLDSGRVVFADRSRVVIAQKGDGSHAHVRPDDEREDDPDDDRPINFYPTAVGWIAS
ncbi:MAG: hypothetical protein U0269_04305 [Polyangiales bacterium]